MIYTNHPCHLRSPLRRHHLPPLPAASPPDGSGGGKGTAAAGSAAGRRRTDGGRGGIGGEGEREKDNGWRKRMKKVRREREK